MPEKTATDPLFVLAGVLVYVQGAILDTATTLHQHMNGATEANPVVGYLIKAVGMPEGLILGKVMVLVGIGIMAKTRFKRFAVPTLVLMGTLQLVAAGINIAGGI